MALTDEQRAMLQLLLEGGQSYEDIGSLLGIGPDEVRSRARSALREMGGADPDARVGLSDYILGQADPIGRADAVRQLQADPEANALAQRLVQQLRLLAPKAQLPELPEPRGGRAAAPPPSPADEPRTVPPSTPPGPTPATAPPARPGLASRAAGALSGLGRASGKRRTQLSVLAAGVIAAAIVAIVLITGSGDGDGGCAPLAPSQAEQAGSPTIPLDAVGAAADADCEPSGKVSLVPVSQQGQQNQQQTAGFAMQTDAVHLEPTADGEQYVLWLFQSEDQARPLGQQTVPGSGDLTGAAPLSGQDITVMQGGTVRLARVTEAESQGIQQGLQSQGRNPTGLVPLVGTPVLEAEATPLLQQLQVLLQAAQQQAQQQQGGQGAGSQ